MKPRGRSLPARPRAWWNRASLGGGIGLLVLLFVVRAASADALDPVTLTLRWSHGFQFAGYYAAQDLGYYRDVGLDVTVREASPGVDVVAGVVAGTGQYGIGNSSLLLARARGAPVVALAVVFQHSALALVTPRTGSRQTLSDLVGRRVMLGPHPEELLAMFQHAGVRPDSLILEKHSFDAQDILDGAVDAMSIYTTSELYYFDRIGFDYVVFSPQVEGIDFYGDTLFTSSEEIRRHPDRVRAFREASLRGWAYALAHPEAVIDMILARAPLGHAREFYQWEARQMMPLIRPDLVEIGYMNPGRWRHIADIYASLGLLAPGVPLDGFLHTPTPPPLWVSVVPYFAVVLGILALLGGVVAYTVQLSRRLSRVLGENEAVKGALAEAEAGFRVLSETTSAGIFIYRARRFVSVNPVMVALTGRSREELLRLDPFSLVHPDDRGLVGARALARDRGDAVPSRYEIRLLTSQGSERWVELSAGHIPWGAEPATIGTVLDLTERRRAEDRLRHMAQHDPLTGLPTRAIVSDRLAHALSQDPDKAEPLALVFVDLDRFKPINGTHGHAVGDRVLREVARRLRTPLRATDVLGRIGGDEFVLILSPLAAPEQALDIVRSLAGLIARPIDTQGLTLHLTASFGISLFPDHGLDEITLARCADLALYEAKRGGRDAVRLYHRDLVRDPADIP